MAELHMVKSTKTGEVCVTDGEYMSDWLSHKERGHALEDYQLDHAWDKSQDIHNPPEWRILRGVPVVDDALKSDIDWFIADNLIKRGSLGMVPGTESRRSQSSLSS